VGRFSGEPTPKGEVVLPPDPLEPYQRLREDVNVALCAENRGMDDIYKTLLLRDGEINFRVIFRGGRPAFLQVSPMLSRDLTRTPLGPPEAA
jgi:hypothetical protein